MFSVHPSTPDSDRSYAIAQSLEKEGDIPARVLLGSVGISEDAEPETEYM
jgi:hypothetical protein